MRMRVFLCLALAAVTVPEALAISPELKGLEALSHDKVALVDAGRRFDLQQKKLIEWDREMGAEYLEQGSSDLAASKQEDIRRRIALIKEAWIWILSYYPNSVRANTYYGELLYDVLGNRMGGIQLWELAVKMDEDYSQAHNNLGLHYFHHGNYDKGLRHLGTALSLEPKNPDYLFNLTQIYLNFFPQIEKKYALKKDKLYKEAMRMSRDAAKYAPEDFDLLQDYAVNFYAAENFGVKADWETAAIAWQAAREKAPTKDQRYYTLLNEGRVWLRAEKPERAVTVLLAAKELMPDSRIADQLLEQANTASKGASS